MAKSKCLILITAAALILPPYSYLHAESPAAPAEVKNMHILYVAHLFMPVESASVIQGGSNCLGAGIINSNTNFMFDQNGKTGNFDIETAALILKYTRRINDSIEVRAMLPFYYNSGGFMDGIIERFHAVLPIQVRNGGREYVDDDEIHIWYRRNEGGPDINSSFYGIGDPSFFVKKVFRCNDFSFAASLGIKLWTGKNKFINSNTTDFGLAFNAQYSAWILDFYAMTGFTYFAGTGTYKEELEQERDWMIHLAPGAGIRIGESVYAVVQFYCSTSPYVTGVRRIDTITVLNSYAVRWRAGENMIFQFSVDEDSFTYAAADITFSLRIACSF